MPELTLQQALDLALQHHQAGRLAEAEPIYRQILAIDPNQPETLHYLALLEHQVGRSEAAIELLRKALALRPAWPAALSNLGEILRANGQLEAAVASFQRALELAPNNPATLSNLGNALHESGLADQAIAVCRRAIALNPSVPHAWVNLGNALHTTGQLDEALTACQRAIQLDSGNCVAHNLCGVILLDKVQTQEAIDEFRAAIASDPNFSGAPNNLGVALQALGQWDEAIAAGRRAIELNSNYHEAYCNLGNALKGKRLYSEAIEAFQRAIALKADYAEAHCNLGNVFQDRGDLDAAIAQYQRASEIDPNFAETYSNLGNVLNSQGEHEAALAAHRQAVALLSGDAKTSARKPRNSEFHSNDLFTQHYHPAYEAAATAEAHRAWARKFAEPMGGMIQPHTNTRTPERRLRIGYVSPDFREHAVARLLLPLLANHDRQRFEIFAYAQVTAPDRLTERLQGLTNVWRNTVGLSDQQVADQIRRDQIDILVDLAGHTANNRLLVFAQKPAPVQVTCLGYPNTTGLSTIDYRLTDALADPPGETEAWHSEQLVRLPDSAWCIELADNPAPRARSAQPITFGCFNNMAKVTEPMLRLWAQLLRQVPDARLLLKSVGMGSAACRKRVETILGDEGISPNRLDLRRPDQQYGGHLAQYHDLDIALDPYPYHGTVSTCEALWMGVPVVTLAGQSHVSRVGVSLLTNVGLPELIAATPEEYVRIAVELANDLPRLTALRSTLRDRMRASPLSDGPNYARQIEAAYRQMWRTWCEG